MRCADKIQAEVGARNSELAPERRKEFRIGVPLGDGLVDGDNLLGDGINVAARLESLAEPGGCSLEETKFENSARAEKLSLPGRRRR